MAPTPAGFGPFAWGGGANNLASLRGSALVFAITFMRNDVRADAQTTIELTAQLTTFLRTDVRADAQTSIELTAQFTTFMATDVTPCRPARVLYSPVNTSGIHTLLYTSQLKWRQPGQLCSETM